MQEIIGGVAAPASGSRWIYQSPLLPVPIPETSLTKHVLRQAGRRRGIALIDAVMGEQFTCQALASAVAAGASLMRRRLAWGDVVALAGHNGPFYVMACMLACLLARL